MSLVFGSRERPHPAPEPGSREWIEALSEEDRMRLVRGQGIAPRTRFITINGPSVYAGYTGLSREAQDLFETLRRRGGTMLVVDLVQSNRNPGGRYRRNDVDDLLAELEHFGLASKVQTRRPRMSIGAADGMALKIAEGFEDVRVTGGGWQRWL